jgi:DNA polymerase V
MSLSASVCKLGREVVLLSENPKLPVRYILEGVELSSWGVITSTVRSHV